MAPHWMRGALIGFGVLVVVLFVWLLLRPPAVLVDLAEVHRGPLTVTIDDEGETRVREVYVISAPLAGRLLRIEHEVGDPVVAGETVLARIQPSDPDFLNIRSQSEAEARVRAAEAALSLAEADVNRTVAERDYARAELGRTEQLIAKGNVSEAALDRSRMLYAQSEAQVETARAAVAVARSELEQARATLIEPSERPETASGRCCIVEVKAPIDGVVLKVAQESEGVVPAGQPLLELGDPSDLEIVSDLLSSDAVRVAEGAPVMIEDWGGPVPLDGRVRRIEPFGFTKVSALGVEEQRVNVVIDLTDPADLWASLGHGYRVTVRIVEWEGRSVLKVPTSALFRNRNEWAVFAVNGDTAQLRTVEVGRSNGVESEIVNGLEPGVQVILHPGDRVEDDTRIERRPA